MSDRDTRRLETIEAIVAATTRLSVHREFDEQSVLEICIEAGVSISSFYHRFPSKDALLREVHRRYLRDIRDELSERSAQVDWSEMEGEALIRRIVREYLEVRLRYARRFRTMALAEHRHPELACARQHEDQTGFDALAELFATRFVDPSLASEGKRRVAFIARVVVLVAQDLTALERNFGRTELEPSALVVDRLAEMCGGYLAPVL